MICSRCQKAVPDESTFCLNCGSRLTPVERLLPINGEGAALRAASAVTEGAPSPTPAAQPAAAGGRTGQQAYALSFRPIVDERLRYRVARWVCEHAPAHALTEVQEGLTRGDFVTFLALTSEEAEAARQVLQGLGVAPALLHLGPATAAEMLIPPRQATRTPPGARGLARKDWIATLVALGALFAFGLVVMRLYGGRGF